MTSIARKTQGGLQPVRKRGFFSTLGSQWQLMLMSVPIFLYVLFFNYFPMYFWVTAFQDYMQEHVVIEAHKVLDNK